jgi:hypothetical protein
LSGFRELNRNEFMKFLEYFCEIDTLKYRNNKWIGLNKLGEPFTVHVKHGSTRKYPINLVRAAAKDLCVSQEDFDSWYLHLR